MAFGNNRSATAPDHSVQEAGGTIFLFRHPLLTGQVSVDTAIDEVDVSKSLQLNANFFQANPSQDSSFQELLVDGSTIAITNHSLAGTATLQVLSTTGFVGTGDFIACAHLIIASGDSTGGTFTVIRFFNGKKRIRVYEGVTLKNVPHELIAGNSVVPYPVVMNYSGWIEGLGAESLSNKTIWAVGNKYGLTAAYKPFGKLNAMTDGGSIPNHTDQTIAKADDPGIFGNSAKLKNADILDMEGIGGDSIAWSEMTAS
jgi:hypothetical protein